MYQVYSGQGLVVGDEGVVPKTGFTVSLNCPLLKDYLKGALLTILMCLQKNLVLLQN